MNDSGFSRYVDRLRHEPHLLVPALGAWLSGWWHRIKFALLGIRVSAGRGFRVYGPLYISGPGRVEFGNDCLIIGNAIKPVCIRTLNANAVVRLGHHAGLNGTAIQSAQSVAIGDWSNIADAYITDTPAHSLSRRRREPGGGEVTAAPVRIGRNVWISVQVVVLHGVSIGDNSVIGACSLVRRDVPANVFCAGNPLTVISEIND